MALILSLDVGTTGLKTILADESGNIVGSSNIEYGMIQRSPGYAEQSPLVWWDAVLKGLHEVLDGRFAGEVRAIGVSGQFQSLVMLDGEHNPLHNAILWCDHRGDAFLSEITEKIGGERLFQITANPALSGSTVSSLLWVKKNLPDIFKRCRHIMLPHEYIRFRLTGKCVTDVTSASSMQLLNVPERRWADELFEKLGIDRGVAGKLCECAETAGETTEEIRKATGLPAGIPVVAGGGDSVVSAIGTGAVREGECFTSVGTSGIICTNTKEIRVDAKGRVNTYCSAVPGMWSVITCSITSGYSLKWMKENFCLSDGETAKERGMDIYSLMDEMAGGVAPGAEGLIFLPYLMGDRTPHLNPDAKGVFFGITSKHGRAEFIRAVMEGAAYSLAEGTDIFRELGIGLTRHVLCGGGARGRTWRGILADIYGNSVCTVPNDSGAAMGAAVLAAVGSGIYRSIDEAVAKMVKTNEEEPYSEERHRKYMERFMVYRELYRRLEDLF